MSRPRFSRWTLWVGVQRFGFVAGLGIVVALLIRCLMPPVAEPPVVVETAGAPACEVSGSGGFSFLLALPLEPSLILLPLLGVMLNGTSSVLYGTARARARKADQRAFALFYTGTLGSSALAPVLYGRLGDATGPVWATDAAAVTASRLCRSCSRCHYGWHRL